MTDDLISRQYAIEHYQHVCRRTSCKECPLHIQVTDTLTDCELELFLHSMPSAEPRWIPVSERLPDDDSACFVTVKYRDIRYTDIAHCFASKDSSVRSWVGANDDDVLAWMPLPEPWKEGE